MSTANQGVAGAVFCIALCWGWLGAIGHARGEERALTALREGARVDAGTLELIDGGHDVELDARPLRLRAAKDEVVSFQVVVRGRPGTAKVALAIAAAEPEVFFERGVVVRAPSESAKVFSLGAAAYPDVLIPTATTAVPGVLWIDLFVPRTATAGLARGELRVEGAAPMAIELEILPLALPARDVAQLGAVSFGSFLTMEKRDPARMRRWMQLAHAHHLNVELMRPVPQIRADGAIDWEGWAHRFGPYLDGTAFTRGPRAGEPVTRFLLPHCEWWPPAPADFPKALAEWEKEAEHRGWLARTEWIMFINSLDEPKTAAKLEAMAEYGPRIEAAHLRDRRRVVFRADGVLGARIPDWPDARKLSVLDRTVDLWNLHGATDTAPLALLAGRRAMFYASNSGGEPAIPPLVVDSPIAGARAWGWIVARYRLAGALNWELDSKEGCVEEPRCSEGGALNLDALLIYRGQEVGRAADEPIPSMRLKALRRGAEDVALLELVRAKDPARADALARELVPRALGDGLPREGRGTWPRDARSYDEAREAMLDLLLDRAPRERLPWGVLEIAAAAILIIALVRLRRRSSS